MFKQASLAAAFAVVSAPAMAGDLYLNPEFNRGYSGSDSTGSVLDFHVGYEGTLGITEKYGYYIQAGPAFVFATGGASNGTELSGKVGLTGDFTDKLSGYGELSGQTVDGGDNSYGVKLGGKYTF